MLSTVSCHMDTQYMLFVEYKTHPKYFGLLVYYGKCNRRSKFNQMCLEENPEIIPEVRVPLNNSNVSNSFKVKDLNPIAIRILNKCYPFHFSCTQFQ